MGSSAGRIELEGQRISGAGPSARLREVDWGQTAFGPLDRWPPALRTTAALVLEHHLPMALWWGPALLQVYNEAYRPLLGARHPAALGRPAPDAGRELWAVLGPVAEAALAGRGTTTSESTFLPLLRAGRPEEAHFSFSCSPAWDDADAIGGVLVTAQEVTLQVQSERQLAMLRGLAAQPSAATFAGACQGAAAILAANDADLPFALVYVLDGDGGEAQLAASAGFGASWGPVEALSGRLRAAGGWPFDEVQAGQLLVVNDLVTRFGPLPGGRWRDSPDRAVLAALTAPGRATPLGFLVAGASPLRPLDDRYQELFRLTAERIAQAVASASAVPPQRSPGPAGDEGARAPGSAAAGSGSWPPAALRPADLGLAGAMPGLASAILEQVPVGVGVFDSEGRVVLSNQLLRGYIPHVIPSRDPEARPHWLALDGEGRPLPPECWPGAVALRGAVVRPGLEFQHRRADGTVEWVLLSAVPFRSPDGRPAGAIMLAQDISARKRAEEDLRSSEQRFRALVQASSDVVYRMSPDWSEMRELHGRSFLPDTEAPTTTWLRKYIRPQDQSRVLARIKGAIRTKSMFELEHPVLRVDGTLGWTFSRAVPIKNRDGEVVEWFGAATDVTERRRAEQRLRAAKDRSEKANRVKDDFLAMLGHELRNPLAPIVAAVELMRLEGGRKFAKERELIARHARHLAALVDDLLDVSRIARGKLELERETLDLEALIDQAVESVGPLLEARRHHLAVDVASGLRLLADKKRLVQVISNLLSNAARYTRPGGRVEIVGRRLGGSIVLTVKDDGIGISADLLPRLFERFQRGSSAGLSEGGLGLGLTIVRSLVELHGGSVSAASAGPGRGSEFTVQLPAAAARLSSGAPEGFRADRGRTQAGDRILLVDDNRDIADVMAQLLRGQGKLVEVAYDGLSALMVARTFQPMVAVLDIGLPDIDGYELARRLRKQPGLAGLALVAMTGYCGSSHRRRSKRAGLAEHLAKPVSVADLLAALERVRPAVGTRSTRRGQPADAGPAAAVVHLPPDGGQTQAAARRPRRRPDGPARGGVAGR